MGIDAFDEIHKMGYHFRFEDDEEGFYLSIINREEYPRIWVDNFAAGKNDIISETPDHVLERSVLAEKDWSERFFGETIDDCLYKLNKWMSFKKSNHE